MARRVTAAVRVTDENGAHVVLAAGDELPAWAADQVTNPAAFEDDLDAEAATDADAPDPMARYRAFDGAIAREPADGSTAGDADGDGESGDVPDYAGMKVTELRDLIEARNEGRDDDARISDAGHKADLVAALTADDNA